MFFEPGATSASITVDIVGDRQVEHDEWFEVHLVTAGSLSFGDDIGRGIIRNDDSVQCYEVAVELNQGAIPLGSKQGDGTVGWQFDVLSDLILTDLGVFDDHGDGLIEPHAVGLWDVDGTLVVQTTVPTGAEAILRDGFRYVPVEPTDLKAGQSYIVGAHYRQSTPDLFPTRTGTITTHDDITYVAERKDVGSQAFGFPEVLGASSGNFFGPNFLVQGVGSDEVAHSNVDEVFAEVAKGACSF